MDEFQKFLNYFQDQSLYLFTWDKPRNFLRLHEKNIYVLFADSINYQDSGIIVVGMPNSGKTTLLNKFISKNNSERFSEDCTTTQHVEDNLYGIKTKFQVRTDFQGFSKKPKVQIKKLIFLENQSYINPNNKLDTFLDVMFNPILIGRKDNLSFKRKIYFIYEKIERHTIPYTKKFKEKYNLFEEMVISK